MGEIVNVFRRMMAACCTIMADALLPDPATTRGRPPPVIGDDVVAESAENFLSRLTFDHGPEEECEYAYCGVCWKVGDDIGDEITPFEPGE